MIATLLTFLAVGIAVIGIQALAALPWFLVLSVPPKGKSLLSMASVWNVAKRLLIFTLVAGAVFGLQMLFSRDRESLTVWGRLYASVLHAQLILDLIVLVFGVLFLTWPKGAAVALAAFREGVRQPMFWFITILILFLVLLPSPFIPYFTFGEDIKMVKEIGFDIIMLAAATFGVLSASMAISEEIEGRTAITLMSKPISRRQFLLGKFAGTLLACTLMIGVLSWFFQWVLWYGPLFCDDRKLAAAPAWIDVDFQKWLTWGELPAGLLRGMAWWFTDAAAILPGLIMAFCQVMVLVGIAVALATRLPMVVNVVVCLLIYFLGHLTPVLAQVSQARFRLVAFIAQLFDIVLPGLDLFNIGPAIARDIPPDPGPIAVYVASSALYAVLYTAIALVFGLILFEDRDLA